MKPNIFFNSNLDSPEEWRAALATHFDDFKFSVAGDVESPENVDVAIVWTLPDGGLERFVNLRAILSLGAGVNQLDPTRLPAHVPLARLVDPSLTRTMVDYAKTAVYRYHRRFHLFERMSRRSEWQFIAPTLTRDTSVAVLGLGELDTPQSGCTPEQRVHRDLDAGEDRAAEVLPLVAHRFDRGRGAEVDDDRRTTEQVVRADGVGDAVGTDLLRVVVEDRHAGAHSRLDDERGKSEVPIGHRAQLGGDARHAGRDGNTRDRRVEREAMKAEELLHHQRELVRRAVGNRRDAPVIDELGIAEQPDDRLRVSGINCEQHVALSPSLGAGIPGAALRDVQDSGEFVSLRSAHRITRRRPYFVSPHTMSRPMSRMRTECVIAPIEMKSAPASA